MTMMVVTVQIVKIHVVMVHVTVVKLMMIVQVIVMHLVNVTMVMYLTAQMTIAVQRLGLVMAYVMVKIRLGAVTFNAMIMMVVTVQKHVTIIHVGMDLV